MGRLASLMLCLVALAPALADAAPKRSPTARAEFTRANPCPSTGKPRGPCAGYVVDHIHPLVCGGRDAPTNMQWQTTADARAKDRIERRGCTTQRP